ncbi:MAG: carbohydrate ABC transporter permease [bacterium]|nr:carbohydrate ABC transporter permease [bacterium]
MKRAKWIDYLCWAGYILIALFAMAPLLWGLRTSLTPNSTLTLLPEQWTLEHYKNIFSRPLFLLYIKNTLLVALGAICVTIPIAMMGGYALARYQFPGKKLSFVFMILPLLPPIAILVPLVSYINKMGIYDTLFAVMMVTVVFSLPFAVWMLRNFIIATPVAIEESALIDGCSPFQVLWRITLPSIFPGIVAVAVFLFINSWNGYLFAFALLASPQKRVLSQAILAFLGAWGTDWGGLSAVGILALIPPVTLFLLFQKWFIAGLVGQQLK